MITFLLAVIVVLLFTVVCIMSPAFYEFTRDIATISFVLAKALAVPVFVIALLVLALIVDFWGGMLLTAVSVAAWYGHRSYKRGNVRHMTTAIIIVVILLTFNAFTNQ